MVVRKLLYFTYLRDLQPAWRIIPVSKSLVTPIYKPFSPFGRGITLLRGPTNHGYEPLSDWDYLPSTCIGVIISTSRTSQTANCFTDSEWMMMPRDPVNSLVICVQFHS